MPILLLPICCIIALKNKPPFSPCSPAEREEVPSSHFLFYLGGVCALIVLMILILGMLAAKRKSKHGVLWLPEGFMAKKDDKRREPVGQDDFGMKSVAAKTLHYIYIHIEGI